MDISPASSVFTAAQAVTDKSLEKNQDNGTCSKIINTIKRALAYLVSALTCGYIKIFKASVEEAKNASSGGGGGGAPKRAPLTVEKAIEKAVAQAGLKQEDFGVQLQGFIILSQIIQNYCKPDEVLEFVGKKKTDHLDQPFPSIVVKYPTRFQIAESQFITEFATSLLDQFRVSTNKTPPSVHIRDFDQMVPVEQYGIEIGFGLEQKQTDEEDASPATSTQIAIPQIEVTPDDQFCKLIEKLGITTKQGKATAENNLSNPHLLALHMLFAHIKSNTWSPQKLEAVPSPDGKIPAKIVLTPTATHDPDNDGEKQIIEYQNNLLSAAWKVLIDYSGEPTDKHPLAFKFNKEGNCLEIDTKRLTRLGHALK